MNGLEQYVEEVKEYVLKEIEAFNKLNEKYGNLRYDGKIILKKDLKNNVSELKLLYDVVPKEVKRKISPDKLLKAYRFKKKNVDKLKLLLELWSDTENFLTIEGNTFIKNNLSNVDVDTVKWYSTRPMRAKNTINSLSTVELVRLVNSKNCANYVRNNPEIFKSKYQLEVESFNLDENKYKSYIKYIQEKKKYHLKWVSIMYFNVYEYYLMKWDLLSIKPEKPSNRFMCWFKDTFKKYDISDIVDHLKNE